MKLKVSALLGAAALIALVAPACAQPVQYQSADGINNTPVSAANPLPVTGTFTAGGVAQGSTTSGQSGTLVQCAVTTAAPTYTTAQTDPLSCTTTGGLRVLDNNSAALLTAAQASIPAGSAIIGKTGIDQTTPGTTNNVTLSTNVGTLPIVQATASVPITFTAAGGPTQIIAASGSTKVYVTHIHYVLSGAGTFALITGTGTNCGTGTTYLEGASGHPLSYAANGGISAGSGLGPIYVTGAGGEICAITTGAVDISGTISYAQF